MSVYIGDVIIASLIFWLVLYFYLTKKFNYWKNKNVFYMPPIPLFGNALEIFTFKKSISQFSRNIYESSIEPIVGFFICREPYLLIRDPELVKAVLIKDFTVFNDRTISENKEDDPMGSHILFILKNPDWRIMRRKISPVFTSAKLKTMFYLIDKAGSEMVEYVEREIIKNSVVDFKEILARYTTDAITSTAFGINAKCFQDENAEFRNVSRRALNWAIWERAISTTCYFIAPDLVKWFKLKFVDSASADFLRNAFWNTMIEREKNKHVRNDLLDILIEIKNQEDIDDPYKLEGDKLVAQATQFFLAGYETTSTAICFTLYELAVHKDIQNTVRKELQDVVKKYGTFSYESLKEMEYLEMCIKEGLRKYPVLGFLDRRCNSTYQIPGTDVVLEEGSPVFISVLGLHYDERYYPNPDKYDPTRFSEENLNKSESQPPYLPFGDGPRNCIGARFAMASLKSSLAKIISTFEIEICDKTQHPIQLEKKGFLMAPSSKVLLKLKKCPSS